MAYRRKRYYKKRYYRNDSIDLNKAIPVLIFFVIIGALSKFHDWYLQLTQSELFIFWSVSFAVAVIVGRLVFKRWEKNRNIKPIEIKSVNLHNNIKYINSNENWDFYGVVDVSDKLSLMQRLRELKPKYFEEFIEMLFRFQDYEIIKSPTYNGEKAQKDGGVDLVVSRDGNETYIQIKKDYRHQTGVSIIRELSGVIKEKQGMVISTSIFSDDAKTFAEHEGIILVDYSLLLK